MLLFIQARSVPMNRPDFKRAIVQKEDDRPLGQTQTG